MTETIIRIRWETGQWDNLVGYVGTVEPWTFQIWHIRDDGHWSLISSLPGMQNKDSYSYGDDPDALKAKAERWLEEFVSSLGAIFPEPPTPDPDCEECGFGLPRHDKDCSHYAMTCKHCKKPIIRCDVLPSHFGCSSAYGYIHDNPRAHACEPRSDGPYAQPESDHA